MFSDPLHWFPNILFSDLLAIVCAGGYLVDYLVPKFTAPNVKQQAGNAQDRGSFLLIQAAALLAVASAVAGRYFNLWVITGAFQWIGLAVAAAGFAFREWAVITLGRSFSRVVTVEQGQQLVTAGPYRWIRHPAYTGMLLVYVGLGMALGSVLGTIAAAVVMGLATFYRIRVEESAMRQALGQQFSEYSSNRWMLFPGW